MTDNHLMDDVQGRADHRHLSIDRVGIQGLRQPISLRFHETAQATVGNFSVSVLLPEDRKGTHMSRMVALVQEHRDLSFERFQTLLALTRQRLDSPEAEISVTCIYFVEKKAPVSGEKSIMDYELTLRGISSDQGNRLWLSVKVPVTSLCPCSKKISDYGAHNQRSHIEITVEPGQVIDPKTLIEIAESEASAELYAILKRPDEKAVTERAYDNPKFVEDLIRDVAGRLRQLSQINAFEVRVENFESIHNHSAVAFLTYTKVANP